MTLYNSSIDIVNDYGNTNVLKILSKTQILTSIKGRKSVAKLRKMMLHNPNVDLALIMCIQNVVNSCPFILKIKGKSQILKSIKGHNSVANLQKIRLYSPSIDLVNAYLYTKFCLILKLSRNGAKTKF